MFSGDVLMSSEDIFDESSDTSCSESKENGLGEGGVRNENSLVMITNEALINNNNKLSGSDVELLKKLEEANRLIETDSKSLNSYRSGHSRHSSDASEISMASSTTTSIVSCNSMAINTLSSTVDLKDTKSSETITDEEDLWIFWNKVVNEWETWSKKKNVSLRDLVRPGIPHHFRGIAWQLLCGAHDTPVKKKYAEYMKTPSACEKVIRRDIARTYPEHDFFKKKDGIGQEALFNVMKAYSIHDREVGYCQGSAFIVGLLLMEMPEEDSFCVLVKIMQVYRMREMFKPSMAELGLCMFQLDTLVQEHIPDLYAHFQSQSIHTNLYASSWFLTLFATSVPISVASRIMDWFLVEGIESILRIALAILLVSKDDVLLLDMEGTIKYFNKEMPVKFETDPDQIFNVAFNLKLNHKRMKKLEKEYTSMKSKEKEDEIELRRLRTENRLLRQRIELLEIESNSLADRLIQGQVTRAEIDETTFALQRELSAIKKHDIDISQELQATKTQIRALSELTSLDSSKNEPVESTSINCDVIQQKDDLIKCLQEELIKIRLIEAENESTIRQLETNIFDLEVENKKAREIIPEDGVASLQEEYAAAKLREAEANLALKELHSKVFDLKGMWRKQLEKREEGSESSGSGSKSLGSGISPNSNNNLSATPNTPKKLLGSFLENSAIKSEVARLEEELMSVRFLETECQVELKEQRLKVMEVETLNKVISNQSQRQKNEITRLKANLEDQSKSDNENRLLLKESQRKYADLESRLKEEKMLSRIREAENAQCIAELTQKVANLEYKSQEKVTEDDLANAVVQSITVRQLQDKIAVLKAQVTRLSLANSKLNQSLSLQNLAITLDDNFDGYCLSNSSSMASLYLAANHASARSATAQRPNDKRRKSHSPSSISSLQL